MPPNDEGTFHPYKGDMSDADKVRKHYQQILSHHIELAQLPRVHAWSADIVKAISLRIEPKVRQIAQQPIELQDIAEDLDVPTRTLQRHLKNEGTNFSNLRDQVRRHFAIKLLVEGQRVDDICFSLCFADRTGFINAFKRWTGLPPNHFRKLYNVYVREK